MISEIDILTLLNKNPVKKMCLGYRQVIFMEQVDFDYLAEEYKSYYQIADELSSRIGKESGKWIAIAEDEVGTPILLDKIEGYIYAISKAEDEPRLYKVASSLPLYLRYIEIMNKVADGRETPEDFRVNPVPEIVSDAIINEIEKDSGDCEIWYWELFLEDFWFNPDEEI